MVLWASTNGRCLIDEIYDVCGTNQQYIVDPKGKQISSHETIMWSGRWRVAKSWKDTTTGTIVHSNSPAEMTVASMM